MFQQLFQLQEEIFKVIANQKRLEILQLLSNQELSVSEMVGMLGLPQANLSQHLALLRQAKIVGTKRDGQVIYYRLSDRRIAKACEIVKEFLAATHDLTDEDQKILFQESSLYPIVKDVVCGMRISTSKAGDSFVFEDTTYYFCASGCRQSFQSDPRKYVTKEVING